MLDNLLQSFAALSHLESLAFLFGIAYVILAARESAWCWPVGIVSVVLSFFVYLDVQLYSDATLQVFYAIISLYGWWTWTFGEVGSKTQAPLEVTTISAADHLKIIVGGIVLAGLLGTMWQQFGAAWPYVDAMTTSFSVIATFLVTRKILENWIYWIIIDTACIFIYVERGIYLFSLLFLVYGIVAIFGYLNWRRHLSH